MEGLFDYDKISFILTKLLGLLIFSVSLTSKLPQIHSIIHNKSSNGISPISSYCDVIVTLFQFSYCYKMSYPFSIHGEFLSLLIQNLLILILSWVYVNNPIKLNNIIFFSRTVFIAFVLQFLYITFNNCDQLPDVVWEGLAASNIPLVSISRFSQIYSIFKEKDAGTVSVYSFAMRGFKNFVKVISLMIETDSFIMVLNQGYNGLLCVCVILLIKFYENKKKKQN